jgi:hypothetical protein
VRADESALIRAARDSCALNLKRETFYGRCPGLFGAPGSVRSDSVLGSSGRKRRVGKSRKLLASTATGDHNLGESAVLRGSGLIAFNQRKGVNKHSSLIEAEIRFVFELVVSP